MRSNALSSTCSAGDRRKHAWLQQLLVPVVLTALVCAPAAAEAARKGSAAYKKSAAARKAEPVKAGTVATAIAAPAVLATAAMAANAEPASKADAAGKAATATTASAATATPSAKHDPLVKAESQNKAPATDKAAADKAAATDKIAAGPADTAVIATPARNLQTASAPAGSRNVTWEMRQLGAWSTIKLRGGNGVRTLAFGVRADEQVVAAKLVVGYDFSPSLLEDLSHLKVSINDKSVLLDSLARSRASGVRREVPIDPNLIRDYNELRFDFVGEYTRQCGNPLHPSLWLNVTDPTRIELTVVPRAIVPDLKTLPAPLLDKGDAREPVLPFVFSARPSMATLRAAGIVASWLGTQAGTRRLHFTTHLNELPLENAIVFTSNDEVVAGQKAVAGARLSIQPHPQKAGAKILIVNGATDGEVLRAARALALNHRSLSGQFAEIRVETEAQPRVPYDAPAWLRTDRPMKFGELAKLEELKAQGYFPEVIRVNYRVPPDVYAWHTHGAPVNLKYRATRLPHHRNSTLGVGSNNNFIDTIALNELSDKPELASVLHESVQISNKSLREVSMFVPPYSLGGRDQLQFTYVTDIIQTGQCEALPPNNFVASIDPESTIDFSQFPKFAALPNLAYFAQLGFPFTRLADLSQTVVALAPKPSVAEIRLYLNVMARMGEATGYPATQHELVSYADLGKASNKDIIAIGTAADQTLMKEWAGKLPMSIENGIRTLKVPNVSWRPRFRWEQRDIDPLSKNAGNIALSDPGTLAAVIGLESPAARGRSAVFLYADRPGDLERIEEQLTHPEKLLQIAGDFVVVGDKSVQSTTASETYFLGEIPWRTRVRWMLADHPILVALATMLLALLSAAALYRPLAMVKRRRRQKTQAAALKSGQQ